MLYLGLTELPKFQTIIQNSLSKVGATRYSGMMLITTKNRFPFVGEVNPDLGTYVTLKVIERIFIEIAQEE